MIFERPRTGRTQRFLYRLAFCLLRNVALPPTATTLPQPRSPSRARRGEPAASCPARGPSSPFRRRS
jgi:hypothetical protein